LVTSGRGYDALVTVTLEAPEHPATRKISRAPAIRGTRKFWVFI
jgi:hypothetical protein